MLKILSIVGARPQFIKAAVISRSLKMHKHITEVIIHTGQHFDNNMSKVFFDEMAIPKPDYNLSINSMSHGAMTGNMIIELEKIFIQEEPDFVIVYGDTNSTLAGAIAAKKLELKLVHVEAGVRNFNPHMPEEINRVLVDRISDFNFACTEIGYDNLVKEGFNKKNIKCHLSIPGDVMFDAANYYSQKSEEKSSIIHDLGLEETKFILCTVHRAENTDNVKTLKTIMSFLEKVNEEFPLVLPIHPRTQRKLEEHGLKPKINLIPPVGYFDMIELIKGSQYIITDSGGLVREAYFFDKKSLLLFDKPVWPELEEIGSSLSGSPRSIKALNSLFDELKLMSEPVKKGLFGNGNAGELIVATLIEEHQKATKKMHI